MQPSHEQSVSSGRSMLASADGLGFLMEWNYQMARLASLRGDREFFVELERTIAAWICFDTFVALTHAESGTAQLLHGDISGDRCDRLVARAHQGELRPPQSFQRNAPISIRQIQSGPEVEMNFVATMPDGSIVVVSMAKAGLDGFTRQEARFLASVQPFLCSLIAEHMSSVGSETASAPVNPLDRRFDALCDRGISQRELQVVRLIIAGHSNHSISDHLSIAVGTVKIHRKNIYRKLNVSAQGELFSLVFGGGAKAA